MKEDVLFDFSAEISEVCSTVFGIIIMSIFTVIFLGSL